MSGEAMIYPCEVLFPVLGVTAGDVVDCAKSGYTIADTAEELGVSRVQMYRVVRSRGLRHLFPSQAVATHLRMGHMGRRAVQVRAWLEKVKRDHTSAPEALAKAPC